MSTKKDKNTATTLLAALTQAHGTSGHEDAVRTLVREHTSLDFTSDNSGNLIGELKGPNSPRVMLEAHMDEVGFMVQALTTDGFVKFVPLGGWWSHTLLAQRVRIRTATQGEVLGVIAATPPHFLKSGDKNTVVKLDSMFIDVGVSNREGLLNLGIQVGDPIVPDGPLAPLSAPDRLMAKAFDNRVGVGMGVLAMERLARRKKRVNTAVFAAAVQEEVGTRGAVTAAAAAAPDVAIVLEGPPADDLPGSKSDERQGAIGHGPQLRLLDPSAIMNRPFCNFIRDVAQARGIPLQLAVRRSGGTDAKVIHLHELGVPTVVIGVPARYIHTHNSIIDINDFLQGVNLVVEVVRRLDEKTVATFTDF